MKTTNNYMELMMVNKKENNIPNPIPNKNDDSKFKGRIINVFSDFDSKMSKRIIEQLIQWEEEDIAKIKANANMLNPAPIETLLEPITININSYGGYIHELMAIVDMLRSTPAPKITRAIGKCMSCAFVLFCIGDVRLVGPNCDLLYHQLSGFMYGKHRDMIEQLEYTFIEQQRIDDLVLERTNLTQEMLDEWNETKQDRHITPEEAVEWGVATDLLYKVEYVETEKETKKTKKTTKSKSKSKKEETSKDNKTKSGKGKKARKKEEEC